MPFNSLMARSNVSALIPEDVAEEVWSRVTDESAAMTLFTQMRARSNQTRVPALSALPVAFFVTGDTGMKQTTQMAWANKFISIEEIACIVPIPEAVLEDLEDMSDFDLWDDVQPFMVEAVGRTLDAAVFFGTNKPASWPTDINASAAAAGNNFTEAAAAAAGGFADDLDAAIALLEADGFDANGMVAARSAKSKLRRLRDTTGQRQSDISPGLNEYLDLPISYPMRGLFPSGGGAGTNVRAFVGDWDQFRLARRTDMDWKLLDQAVITDAGSPPVIQFNLPQQDMVAMRLRFRVGWQVANIINYDQPTDASRYPVSVVRF